MTDMTHSLQRCILWQQQQQHLSHNETSSSSSSCRLLPPDSRFFWNEVCVQDILHPTPATNATTNLFGNNDKYEHEQQRRRRWLQHVDACRRLQRYVIPVTSAFVGIQRNVTIPHSSSHSCPLTYDQVLISRRSRFRAGTRFTKRGADATGAVANYAETEQVCWIHHNLNNNNNEATGTEVKQVFGHVQTRGSIPLRWSSPADVKTYRPKVRIGTDPLAQAMAVHSHLTDEFAHYVACATANSSLACNHPQLLFVNLVDKKQDQGRLGRSFDAVLQAVLDVCSNSSTVSINDNDQRQLNADSVQHLWFDFHAQVKGGRWGRLGSLLKEVKPTLDEQGYFSAVPASNGSSWTVLRTQLGVVRTNCMDCLDRTNVVQSIFGRYMLFRQLDSVRNDNKRVVPLNYSQAFRRDSLALPWTFGEVSHRLLWADNADAISRLYAGTPALKGDFTRTGKRTKKGALDDGMNSLQRYYLNNFLDADRQEGMDLLVGYADFSTDLITNDKDRFAKERRIAATRGLELLWLPGDLQSHVRSHAWGVNQATKDALESMDQRAASDHPWWMTDDSSSGEDSAGDDEPVVRSTVNTGYMIGGLLAALKAPAATAAAIVCMLGFTNSDTSPGEK